MNNHFYIIRSVVSLRNMFIEMNRKNLELKRITKTASLLLMCGLTPNSIPDNIICRCLKEQQPDGGWINVVDTIWNTFFLKILNHKRYAENIKCAIKYLNEQQNTDGLWGRSKRDISRIPVSGLLFYLLPELASKPKLRLFESLWVSEINSLTYKAAYVLMAFKANHYSPLTNHLVENTIFWLSSNQRDDGGFAPWKNHPVESNVYCTALSSIGLLQYPELVDKRVFINAAKWLKTNQLESGIWQFHEIEDGASWGILALHQLSKLLKD